MVVAIAIVHVNKDLVEMPIVEENVDNTHLVLFHFSVSYVVA